MIIKKISKHNVFGGKLTVVVTKNMQWGTVKCTERKLFLILSRCVSSDSLCLLSSVSPAVRRASCD